MHNKGLGDILLKYVERLFDEKRQSSGRELIDRVGRIYKKDHQLITQVIEDYPYKVSIPTIKLPKHSEQFFAHRYSEEMKKNNDEREFFHLGDGSKVDHLFNSYSGHIYGKSKCTCNNEVSMCKHIAALLFKVIKNLDETDETLFALVTGYETNQYSTQTFNEESEGEMKDLDAIDFYRPASVVQFTDIIEKNPEIIPLQKTSFAYNIALEIPDYRRAIEKVIMDISFRENVSSVLYLVNMYRSHYEKDEDNRIKKLAVSFNERMCIYDPQKNVFCFKSNANHTIVKISVEHIAKYLSNLPYEKIENADSSLVKNLWLIQKISKVALINKCYQAGIYVHSTGAHKIIIKPHRSFLSSDAYREFSDHVDITQFAIGEQNNYNFVRQDKLLEYFSSVFLTNELYNSVQKYKFNDFLQYSSGIDGQMSKSLWIDSKLNLKKYATFINQLYKPSEEWNAVLDVESYEKDVVFSITYVHMGSVVSIDEEKSEDSIIFKKFIYQVLKDCGFIIEGTKAILHLPKLKDIREIQSYLNFYGLVVNAPDTLFNPEQLEFSMHWEVEGEAEYLMDADAQISLVDNRMNKIPEQNLRHILDSGQGVYELNRDFYHVDESVLNIIRDYLRSPKRVSGINMMRSVLIEEYKGEKIYFGDHLVSMRNKLFEIPECGIPEEFVDVLRPYQVEGLKWLWKNTQMGLGSLLADDMGLGKTIQLLALISAMYKIDKNLRTLIVVPTAVISNWMNEAKKFVPHIKFHAHYGSERQLDDIYGQSIVITSYGMVRSDYNELKQFGWDIIALDEAQKIKNPSTKISRVIKTIEAKVKVALTGTPIENRLLEYWNILDFLNKGILGSKSWFKKNFATPIEKYGAQNTLNNFVKMTSPFTLRRLKTDKSIISDLPDKIVSNEICDLSTKQRKMYLTYVDQMLKVIEGNEGIKRKGLILKMMTDLKKICNHPKHFDPSQKLQINSSGKMVYLLNLLDVIRENEEKVLLFTQYVQMGELLKELLKKEFDLSVGFYKGSLNRKQRDNTLKHFKEKKGFDVLIISLKAGGTGLNLTEASHVIHYDLWWNPAVEDQATDRAFRIGQEKNVFVQRLISKGTFEEKINKMLQSKRGLADSVLNVESSWIGELSNEELAELFTLEDYESVEVEYSH